MEGSWEACLLRAASAAQIVSRKVGGALETTTYLIAPTSDRHLAAVDPIGPRGTRRQGCNLDAVPDLGGTC